MKYKVKTPISIPPSRDPRRSSRQEITKWVDIGRGWQDKPGEKITVVLDTIPFRSEYIYLFPVNEEDEDET